MTENRNWTITRKTDEVKEEDEEWKGHNVEEEENDGVVFLRGQNRIRGENDGQIDKIWHKGVKTQMKNMWLNVRLPSEERKRQRDGETAVREWGVGWLSKQIPPNVLQGETEMKWKRTKLNYICWIKVSKIFQSNKLRIIPDIYQWFGSLEDSSQSWLLLGDTWWFWWRNCF